MEIKISVCQYAIDIKISVCQRTADIYQWPPRPSTVAGSLLAAYGFCCPAWFTSILSASPVSPLQVWFLLGYELPEGTLFGATAVYLATLRCSYCSASDAGPELYCSTEPITLPGLGAAPV
jgi:hypothetical protein